MTKVPQCSGSRCQALEFKPCRATLTTAARRTRPTPAPRPRGLPRPLSPSPISVPHTRNATAAATPRPTIRRPPASRRAPMLAIATPSTAPSISAPTTAACCWRALRGAASAWSTRSRASSGSARASARPGDCRSRHGTHARCAQGLRRQARPRQGAPLAPCRHRSLPHRREQWRVPGSACATSLGLDIEILTREAEARLAVSGSAALIDPSCDYVLVFDIGGGSSELILLDLCPPRPASRPPCRPGAMRSTAWSRGPRCRSASSRWPSALAAATWHPTTSRRMVAETTRMLEPFEVEHSSQSVSPASACTCSAPRAP